MAFSTTELRYALPWRRLVERTAMIHIYNGTVATEMHDDYLSSSVERRASMLLQTRCTCLRLRRGWKEVSVEGNTDQPRPATFVAELQHFSSTTANSRATHQSCQHNIIAQPAAHRRCNERLHSLHRASCPTADQRRSACQPGDARCLCRRSAGKACQRCQGVSRSLQASRLISD